MNSFSQSAPSSAVPSISDLDGYTIRDYSFQPGPSYLQDDQDDFGFDPPQQRSALSKLNQHYSPSESVGSPDGEWPGFEREDEDIQKEEYQPTYHIDKPFNENMPNPSTSISRFGQVTPPRTDSSGSVEPVKQESRSPSTKVTERPRRKAKPAKEVDQNTTTGTTTAGRKRKTSRKALANAESGEGTEDTKRKASLEKNRLAAAKCRINKKDKTEQLQRDSHDKAVHNAYLRSEIMRMREEVQHLNAILLAHAGCEGCKSPEEIQKHLQELSAEYLPHQLGHSVAPIPDFDDLDIDGMSTVSQQQMGAKDYFDMHASDSSMLHPPLPEFNRSADFEVLTPMRTD